LNIQTDADTDVDAKFPSEDKVKRVRKAAK
jgi:hypothetical protein